MFLHSGMFRRWVQEKCKGRVRSENGIQRVWKLRRKSDRRRTVGCYMNQNIKGKMYCKRL